MWIDIQPQLLFFVADFLAPDCCERKKEALLRRKTVDFFVALFRMLGERFLEGGVSEFHSANVGNVLTLGERAVHVQSRQRLIFIVLIDDRLRALLEFLA